MLPHLVGVVANVLVIAHICLQWTLQGHIITVFIISCLLCPNATPTNTHTHSQRKRQREDTPTRVCYLFSMHFVWRRGNVKFNLIATTEGQKEHESPKADTHTHIPTLANTLVVICHYSHGHTHTHTLLYYCFTHLSLLLLPVLILPRLIECVCVSLSVSVGDKNPVHTHTYTYTNWQLLLSCIFGVCRP